MKYPLVNIHKTIEMAIEIVSFPNKNCDFPYFFVCLPEGKPTSYWGPPRHEISRSLRTNGEIFVHLSGRPGTGKTKYQLDPTSIVYIYIIYDIYIYISKSVSLKRLLLLFGSA